MTIEIHNPELEAILQQRIRDGNFASVEDMLLNPSRRSRRQTREIRKRKPSMLQPLRRGVKLDRPEGMSLREYAHIGHRY